MKKPLFIKWHGLNEVGVHLLDEQHKGIVSIINTFYHMMGTGMHRQLMYSCISDTMKNYSRIHFLTEENFLEQVNYEHLEKHKNMHLHLSHEIEKVERECIRANDPLPLLDFLKMWWTQHINEEDKQYSECLRTYLYPLGKKRRTAH